MSLQLLGKNTTIYAFGNIILRAGAFLLIPIYTNYLTINEYGLLASLFITIEVLAILMNSGMRNSLVRFFKEFQEKNKSDELLGTSVLINIIGGIIVTGLCLLFFLQFFQSVFHTQNLNYLIELACSAALMESLYLHLVSYYRAKNEAHKFLYFGVSTFTLLLVSNLILLVYFNMGVQGVLIARIISYGIILLIIISNIVYKIGMRISFPLVKKLMKFGFPLIFSMSGEKVIYLGVIYILSFYAGLKAVAIFSLGLKFASILNMAITLPVQMALEPYIFANLNQEKIKDNLSNFFTYYVFLIAFGSLAVIIFSKIIIPIISPPEYWLAVQIVILLIPALAIKGLKIYGEAFLNIVKKTYLTGMIVGFCGLLSIFTHYLFIINWGLYGAIISLSLINVILTALISGYGHSAYVINIDWRRVIIGIFFFAFFLLSTYLLTAANNLVFYLSMFSIGILTLLFSVKNLKEDEQKFLKKTLLTVKLSITKNII